MAPSIASPSRRQPKLNEVGPFVQVPRLQVSRSPTVGASGVTAGAAMLTGSGFCHSRAKTCSELVSSARTRLSARETNAATRPSPDSETAEATRLAGGPAKPLPRLTRVSEPFERSRT